LGGNDVNQYILIAVLLLIVFAFWMYTKNSGAARISAAEAKRKLDTQKGIILLDVRTKDEYIKKHIPKSTLIPVNVLEKEVTRKITDKNTEIFVYCQSGSRSAMAVKILAKLGYTNINNLGGITAWPYETVSGNK
jgi:rhodanese-related sulfurtransferase